MNFHNPLKRISHLEDLLLLDGYEGFKQIIRTISRISNYLACDKSKDDGFHINHKYDGSPSIVFGRNGHKHFVATKSIFNKKPKINYTFNDVMDNHTKSSTALVAKLSEVLDRLPDMNLKPDAVYQGDLLYTRDDIDFSVSETIFTCKPNLLKYMFYKSHAKDIGIAVHTKYNLLDGVYHQSSLINYEELDHANNDTIKIINPSYCHYPDKDKNRYSKAVSRIEYIDRYDVQDVIEFFSNKLNPELLNSLAAKFGTRLIAHNNYCVANNLPLKYQDIPGELKSQDNFNFIVLFNAVAMIKEKIISDLVSQGLFPHNLDTPEGFVVTHDWFDTPIKLVNRRDFTYKNHILHSNK